MTYCFILNLTVTIVLLYFRQMTREGDSNLPPRIPTPPLPESVANAAPTQEGFQAIVLCEGNAIVSVSDSGNQARTSIPEGGIAAQISVTEFDVTPDDRLDLDIQEDEDVPVGSDFVYDDATINELFSDRYGVRRAETELKKSELLGTSTTVGGQVWTVRGDIESEGICTEEFLETGLRSNDINLNCLPLRLRTRGEILMGTRSSPRISPPKRQNQDEGIAINGHFMALFPVNWKQSLKRLNDAIASDTRNLKKKSSNGVSTKEYWTFIGILILCAVQKSGGVDSLFKNKQTEGIIQRVNAGKYMSYTRFKFIKSHWVRQFELRLSPEEEERNPWWRVGYLVHGFNENRKKSVAASRVKTLDESMSAYRPQTRKSGNLPNISFILRKPEPLGTELKTVASMESNGPIIYAEVQEGKQNMSRKPFFLLTVTPLLAL